jgi:ribosomal protein L11 methylase PrmA
LITAAKDYGAKGIGVEIDPFRVLIAKGRVFFRRLQERVQIRRGNLFTTDITPASVIIVYLIPKALNRLEEKFSQELKPGTRVVSYVYKINYLPLVGQDKKHKVYVYKIPIKKKTTA